GLHDHRDDHGSAPVARIDPPPDRAPDSLLHLVRVGGTRSGNLFDLDRDLGTDLVEHRVVFGEAPGVDLRAGGDLPGDRVNHHDDRDEALLAQDAPVFQRRLGYSADALAVNVDVATWHRADDARDTVGQIDDHAVASHDDPVAGDAGADRDLGVRAQMTIFAVDGHHITRLDQVVDEEQFAGTGVSGRGHHGVALVDDRGTLAGQPVDHPRHRVLVAGYQ